MAQSTLANDSPKVFHALARFLSPEELALVGSDYAFADAHGGNRELRLSREVGVSFNPRLARIVSILIHDLGVRDLSTIRAALYCAVFDSGCGIPVNVDANPPVPLELHSLVSATTGEALAHGGSGAIRAVIALDSIRHLHQGEWSDGEREDILAQAEQIARALAGSQQESVLIAKLSHAITLQRRRGGQ